MYLTFLQIFRLLAHLKYMKLALFNHFVKIIKLLNYLITDEKPGPMIRRVIPGLRDCLKACRGPGMNRVIERQTFPLHPEREDAFDTSKKNSTIKINNNKLTNFTSL